MIFPFATCWRHYVELQLKSLIKECKELLDKPVTKRGGHNIVQFWSELRPLLVEAYPDEGRRDLGVVSHLLKQLTEMDPANQKPSSGVQVDAGGRRQFELSRAETVASSAIKGEGSVNCGVQLWAMPCGP